MRNFLFFIKSFYFFSANLFIRRKYDVVFYCPQHFNRGDKGVNEFFQPLINSCAEHNLNYLLIEEPDYETDKPRNKSAIPFDFIFIIILLLRKLFPVKENLQSREKKIGNLLSMFIFRQFDSKNYIVLSQSMLGVFRGISPSARLFDLQHGILHNDKENYLVRGKVSDSLRLNNVYLLLFGKGFKDILIKNENETYFKDYSIVIGKEINPISVHKSFNNNILITLQFTHDHSSSYNQKIRDDLTKFIKSFPSNFIFFLKDHPRFNNAVDLSSLYKLNNVRAAPKQLRECFTICSVHATVYSTAVFEAALFGIPSVFLINQNFRDYFQDDFQYPICTSLLTYSNKLQYQQDSNMLKDWVQNYFQPFDSKKFILALSL